MGNPEVQLVFSRNPEGKGQGGLKKMNLKKKNRRKERGGEGEQKKKRPPSIEKIRK